MGEREDSRGTLDSGWMVGQDTKMGTTGRMAGGRTKSFVWSI